MLFKDFKKRKLPVERFWGDEGLGRVCYFVQIAEGAYLPKVLWRRIKQAPFPANAVIWINIAFISTLKSEVRVKYPGGEVDLQLWTLWWDNWVYNDEGDRMWRLKRRKAPKKKKPKKETE